MKRFSAIIAASALMISCSSSDDIYDEDDPISGSTPSSLVDGGADGVDDGSSGGLDLDNGNVEGSDDDDTIDENPDSIDDE